MIRAGDREKLAGVESELSKDSQRLLDIIKELESTLVGGGYFQKLRFKPDTGQIINTGKISNLSDAEFRRVESLVKELRVLVEKKNCKVPDDYTVESGDKISPDSGKKRDNLNKVKIDEKTGMFVCPECGKLVNQNCGNCFHNRFKDEDPFNFNPEK